MPTSRVKKLVISASTYRLLLVNGASGSSAAGIPRFSKIAFFSIKVLKRFSVRKERGVCQIRRYFYPQFFIQSMLLYTIIVKCNY